MTDIIYVVFSGNLPLAYATSRSEAERHKKTFSAGNSLDLKILKCYNTELYSRALLLGGWNSQVLSMVDATTFYEC